MNNPIRDILDKLWKDAWGKLGAYNFDGTGEDTLTKDQAEQAINAYILGEVMELINSCYDKDYGIDSVALHNKANERWGK